MSISLPSSLAREVDQIARKEGRTRSELLREAFRQYAARLDRWERLLAGIRRAGPVPRLSERDVARTVKEYRRRQAR